jgi:hypothetical protein
VDDQRAGSGIVGGGSVAQLAAPAPPKTARFVGDANALEVKIRNLGIVRPGLRLAAVAHGKLEMGYKLRGQQVDILDAYARRETRAHEETIARVAELEAQVEELRSRVSDSNGSNAGLCEVRGVCGVSPSIHVLRTTFMKDRSSHTHAATQRIQRLPNRAKDISTIGDMCSSVGLRANVILQLVDALISETLSIGHIFTEYVSEALHYFHYPFEHWRYVQARAREQSKDSWVVGSVRTKSYDS